MLKGFSSFAAVLAAESAYDADAETLFAAMSVQPDDTRKQLISDTITSLKAAGIWDELDELWMLAAHDEQAGLLGWKRYKDCLAVNAPTFTADEGFAGNGSTSYLNTQLVPSTDGVQYTLNDASYGVYSRTDNVADVVDMGSREASLTTKQAMMFIRHSAIGYTTRTNMDGSSGQTSVASPNSLGFFVARRTASNAQQAFKNGASVATGAAISTGVPPFALLIGVGNNGGTPGGFSMRQYAFAFAGAAMTPTQQSDFFDIVESHLDSLGAGVVA